MSNCEKCGANSYGYSMCYKCRTHIPKKNKDNHLQVETLIAQAIKACSYDNALSETKSYLTAAFNTIGKVSKKRARSAANQQQTKTQQQVWWEMLQKNASKNINLSGLDEI